MYTYKILVEIINGYEKEEKWFWVASFAKETAKVLKNHLEELLPVSRMAVEHYTEEV